MTVEYIKYFANLCYTPDQHIEHKKPIEHEKHVEPDKHIYVKKTKSYDDDLYKIYKLNKSGNDDIDNVREVVNYFFTYIQEYKNIKKMAAEKVVKLFICNDAEHNEYRATLLATSSQKYRQGTHEIKQYFDWFCAQIPVVDTNPVEDPTIQMIGEKTYLVIFFVRIKGGENYCEPSDLPTDYFVYRFSFVISEVYHEGWKIINLHASGVPPFNPNLHGEPTELESPYDCDSNDTPIFDGVVTPDDLPDGDGAM